MHNPGNINKNFPYPVLGNINDFDGSNLFVLTARYGAKNRQYEFTCNLKYDAFRDDYEDFVKEKKMKYVIQAFNAQTFYREYFEGYVKEIRFDIPQNRLRGMVLFTGFITAAEDIFEFSPINQNEEFYGKSKFDILKGGILAVSNTLKHHIDPNFNKQDNTNGKHIITFVEDENIKTHFRVKAWADDQLKVGIPKKLYQEWSNHTEGDNRYFHHCALYLPVLTEAIWRVESDDENKQFADLKWYHVIEQLIEKMDFDPNLDPHIKAQKLMMGPFKPYVKQLDLLMETFISG